MQDAHYVKRFAISRIHVSGRELLADEATILSVGCFQRAFSSSNLVHESSDQVLGRKSMAVCVRLMRFSERKSTLGQSAII
jgi:hypothetical protein